MHNTAKHTIRAAALALLAFLASAPFANAQIDGKIQTKDKKVNMPLRITFRLVLP